MPTRTRTTGPRRPDDGFVYRELSAEYDMGRDLEGIVDALRDNKRVWQTTGKNLINDPSSYEKPERFINDPMPRGGFGGGYDGRVRVRPLKRALKVTSNRPYVPLLKPDFFDALEEALVFHWIDRR